MSLKIGCILLVQITVWISVTNSSVIPILPKSAFPSRLVGLNESVKDELIPFTLKHNPVDLSIDSYDDNAPMNIRKALAEAALSNDTSYNQMTDFIGLPRFRQAVAALYSKVLNRNLDPDQNVLITEGAFGGFNVALNAHTAPGDEWILIEPAYVMYLPMIKLAYGVPRFTTLKLAKKNGTIDGDDWVLDKEEMESLFNSKTKGIILNNPLNPLGKVYRLDELQFIADLAIKYNVLVISDEAHEWITQKPHIRIASLPGMFERTITVGSSSKSFSVGGWRVGWAYGSAGILNHIKVYFERTFGLCPTPQQYALAVGMEEELKMYGQPDSFFVTHVREMREKRDLMVKAFQEAGMAPIVPDGGFCMLVDWTPLKDLAKVEGENVDTEFAKWLIEKAGVLGWPASIFYNKENEKLGRDYLRFCIHKKDEMLKETIRRLQKLKSYQ